MGIGLGRTAFALAFAATLASCSSTPPKDVDGEEELSVSATLRVPAIDPITGQPVPATFNDEKVPGVACTMGNDKGTWTVVTPAKVRVRTSSAPLEVECAKEGFRTERAKVPCLTPRQRQQATEPPGLLALSVIAIPAGVLTAPVGGAGLAVQGLLGVGEHAYASSRPDVCSYGGLLVHMAR